jgi:outer membrane protein OmpA-like peptidoglycan-associated protein
MRKALLALTLLAFAAAGSTACATKGFVKNQVSQVSGKVDTLSQSLEQTQERTKQNEEKIAAVDGKAGAAQGAADNAATAAKDADAKAVTAGTAANSANEAAKAVAAKADELDKNAKKLVYTVVLSEDQGGFKFGQSKLPDAAKTRIDDMVKQLMADPKGAYFEIEGHTDNTGDKTVNQKLGMDRAEVVKRYLYETYQIPLHRINVISYGQEKPVADNKTKDGRAQNRRVVIRVLN